MNIYNIIKEQINKILDEDLWHGSPKDFEEFLLDKIGTGEGVQAFGWGLYFTELEGIAKDYAQKLAKKDIIRMYNNDDMPNEAYKLLSDLDFLGYDDEWAAVNVFYSDNKKNIINDFDITELQYDKINNSFLQNKRVLYKISTKKDINTYNWLQWDKPISEKNKNLIKNKLDSKYGGGSVDITGPLNRGDNGQDIYKGFAKYLGSYKNTSLFLLNIGIDGIKYPAESIARGKTSDSARGFNYVIFDPSIIKIEQKIKY